MSHGTLPFYLRTLISALRSHSHDSDLACCGSNKDDHVLFRQPLHRVGIHSKDFGLKVPPPSLSSYTLSNVL